MKFIIKNVQCGSLSISIDISNFSLAKQRQRKKNGDSVLLLNQHFHDFFRYLSHESPEGTTTNNISCGFYCDFHSIFLKVSARIDVTVNI